MGSPKGIALYDESATEKLDIFIAITQWSHLGTLTVHAHCVCSINISFHNIKFETSIEICSKKLKSGIVCQLNKRSQD